MKRKNILQENQQILQLVLINEKYKFLNKKLKIIT